MAKFKSLTWMLRDLELTNNNLHKIAISNLSDGERRLKRWWMKKYRTPLKEFEDHTKEELIIEMLEDFYENHPEEIDRFYSSLDSVVEDWDGTMPESYEREIKERLERINKKNNVDISKYQTSEELTPEEEQRILDNLGKNLPKSQIITKRESVLGEDEFEDVF